MTTRPEAAADDRSRWGAARGWRLAVLCVLALATVGVGLHQAAHDSVNVDESVDISAGVTALVRHDLRVVPEHAFGPKALATLPALLAHPVVPDSAAYRRGAWFSYSADFVTANRRAHRLRSVVFLSRLVPLAEVIGCAALLALLAGDLFGPDAALFAAGIWLTTPFVVGLGHFVSIDMAFTLTTLAVSLALLRFWRRPSVRGGCWLGLFVGLALTTRHTALVLLAVVVLVVAWRLRTRRRELASVLGCVLFGSVAVVWAVYRLLSPGGPHHAVAARFDAVVAAAQHRSVAARLVLALPFPQEWRAGFAYLTVTSDARVASAFGHSWVGTRWWYFPAAVVVKLPVPAIAAVLVGLGLVLRRQRVRRVALLTVGLPAAFLTAFTVLQPLELGARLMLPVLALVLVLASPVATLVDRSRMAAGALAIVAATQVAASILAVPHSLAWTPWPFQPAYRWTSDSNVDYGQDLYRLADWAKPRDPWIAVDTARGMETVVAGRKLVSAEPGRVTGWVAVGVTALTELERKPLAWLRAYCPVATIGGSILVYRFTTPPTAAPGPERPVAPCYGAQVSVRR